MKELSFLILVVFQIKYTMLNHCDSPINELFDLSGVPNEINTMKELSFLILVVFQIK